MVITLIVIKWLAVIAIYLYHHVSRQYLKGILLAGLIFMACTPFDDVLVFGLFKTFANLANSLIYTVIYHLFLGVLIYLVWRYM